ncbi:hypothetical protein ISP17_11265 [Dyella ginsengisoli]|uniref:AAA family ATPase n=1 Tax=Dyella ginsengisoli TaxID=363848 RepID=A0ABW8JTT9_9GAMM
MKATATIITGPQGAGKSRRARELAAAHGPFLEMTWEQLQERRFAFPPGVVYARTVIVDEVPSNSMAIDKIKSLITRPAVRIAGNGEQRSTTPTPNFIFLSSFSDSDAVGRPVSDRRWTVIHT